MKKYDNEYQMRKNYELAVNEIKSKLSQSLPTDDGRTAPPPAMLESTVTDSFKEVPTEAIKRIVERTLLLSNENQAGPAGSLPGEKEDPIHLRYAPLTQQHDPVDEEAGLPADQEQRDPARREQVSQAGQLEPRDDGPPHRGQDARDAGREPVCQAPVQQAAAEHPRPRQPAAVADRRAGAHQEVRSTHTGRLQRSPRAESTSRARARSPAK